MKKYLYFILTGVVGIVFLLYFLQSPSLERNWNSDQEIVPEISFSGSEVFIKNLRNFKYSSTTDYVINYYDKSYNFDEIESMYYIIEPFSSYDGPAHTMMSFGFSDGTYVSISPEIRKEVGESFSALKGLFRQYEIIYMIGDEKDLVKLRANYRKDDMIMYPIKTEKENIKNIFISMLERAERLTKKPEFYNTLINNCATSILQHANEIRDNSNKSKISWSKYALLPSHSDTIVYDLGLIDTKMSLEEARKYYKINELSEQYADSEDYSKMIRKERK